MYGNEARRIQLNHLRLSQTKFLVDESVLDQAEIEKIFEQTPTVLRIQKSSDGNIGNSIVELNHVIPFDVFNYTDKTFHDAQQVLGFGTNQLGQVNPGRRTRGEVELVEAHTQIRVEERRLAAATVIQNMFRKANQYLLAFWKEPMVLRVVGVEGLQHWVRITPSNIKAELDTKVQIESMLPPSRERTKREMLEIATLLGNVNPQGVMPLLRQLLSRFPWADVNSLLPQAPGTDVQSEDQFVQQQQQALQNPNLGQETQRNLGALMG